MGSLEYDWARIRKVSIMILLFGKIVPRTILDPQRSGPHARGGSGRGRSGKPLSIDLFIGGLGELSPIGWLGLRPIALSCGLGWKKPPM